jgi:hypothetical protein
VIDCHPPPAHHARVSQLQLADSSWAPMLSDRRKREPGARFDADAARNAYSRASEVIRTARGRLRGELAMPDVELGADS